MGLKDRVKEYDALFGRLIDLIQPKFYFADQQELSEELELDKRAIFEDEAETHSKQTLHRNVKLNPDLNKNVSKIIDEKCVKPAKKRKKKAKVEDEISTDDPWNRKVKLNMKNEATERNSKLNELHVKLKRKIDELQKSRKSDGDKKVKRETKKARREKNRNLPGSKQKGFVKKDALNKEDVGEHINNGTEKETPKIYNKEGKLIFSKFDFVTPPLITTNDNSDKREKHKTSKVKKLKKSLNQIKKEKEMLKELESSGKVDEAVSLKKKTQWRNAVMRSEGEKVKDNQKLIETSLKRKQKTKKKHFLKWEDRQQTLEKKMDKKQEKRNRNLQQRKEKRKEAKIKRSKKKGRVVFND